MSLTKPAPSIRLYSLRAIGGCTLLAGPLGGGILVGLNYWRLGDKRAAAKTLAVACVVTALLILGVLSIPPDISRMLPRELIPLLYTPAVVYLSKRFQGDAIKRAMEGGCRKASAWAAAGWGLLATAITLGMLVPFVLKSSPIFHGEKQTFGPKGAYAVYSEGDVGQGDAKALADYLIAAGYFSGDAEQAVQVSKKDGIYTLSIPIAREHWNDEDVVYHLDQLKIDMAQSVLQGKVKIIVVAVVSNKVVSKEF